jgi:DNA polymerase III epsilon subunit-like protein
VRIQSCYFREKPQAGNSRITESCFFFVTERVMGGVEIVFLDVETTIPYKKGQKFEILEFGAIVLCAQGLVEKTSFCTYVQPSSMAAISKKSVDCNGITKNDAAHAPFFSQIADHVYNLLDGRVWAGHNILSFDIPRIQEAFAEAGLQAPTAAGVIDTLPLLKSTFGCRAGNMKKLFFIFLFPVVCTSLHI